MNVIPVQTKSRVHIYWSIAVKLWQWLKRSDMYVKTQGYSFLFIYFYDKCELFPFICWAYAEV